MSKKDNKTTSKNNPNARKKTIVGKQYNNTDVVPMMLLRSRGKRCIVAQYKNGSLVTNADGNPVMYSDI